MGPSSVPIRPAESELGKRIAEVIGDESLSSFGRRCGLAESLLRKYLAGAQPSTDRLVAIADAGNVRIAWLAAGRGPMKGSDEHPPTSAEPGKLSDLFKPGLDHLIAVCRAGNISLDWIATGEGPVHLQAHSPVTFSDPVRLRLAIEAVEEGLRAIGRALPPDKYAQLVVAAYQLMPSPDTDRAKVVDFIKAAA